MTVTCIFWTAVYVFCSMRDFGTAISQRSRWAMASGVVGHNNPGGPPKWLPVLRINSNVMVTRLANAVGRLADSQRRQHVDNYQRSRRADGVSKWRSLPL